MFICKKVRLLSLVDLYFFIGVIGFTRFPRQATVTVASGQWTAADRCHPHSADRQATFATAQHAGPVAPGELRFSQSKRANRSHALTGL